MSQSTVDQTTLVSLFHTKAEAAKAMADLQAAGVPTQSIQSLGGSSDATSAPESSLSTLKTLNLPADDLRVLSSGIASGGTLLIVRAEQAIATKAEAVFEQHARKIDERTTQASTQPKAVAAAAAPGDTVIPIVEEQLVVGKQNVMRGGVRVFSRLVEVPVEEQVTLREEHATMERHAVNRPISASEVDAFQNKTVEVREMAEEAVVGKTARVVEEVYVGKETTERNQQIHDTVRKTQVEVDQLAAEPAVKKAVN